MEGRHRWSAVQPTWITLSSEILCAFQLGLNVRDPYVECSIAAFDVPIMFHGKDNIDLEKTKRKRQLSSLGEKKILEHAASELKLCFRYLSLSSCYEKLNGKTDPLFLKLGNSKVTVQCFYGYITNEK